MPVHNALPVSVKIGEWAPSERLAKIIAAYTPREVVFKASKFDGESLKLEVVVVRDGKIEDVPEDKPLQLALQSEIKEHWNSELSRYQIDTTIHGLFSTVKQALLHEYDRVSTRCAATKRKTEQFIRNIKIEDKHLANYLIQTFLQVRSDVYANQRRVEREPIFEQFETLRRVYGKRS